MSREDRPDAGLTLADCALIILGTALVLSLPWHNGPDGGMGGAVPAGRWYSMAPLLNEISLKVSLALIPVIIFRCHREKRVIRPAELLTAALGVWPLVAVFEHSKWAADSGILLRTVRDENWWVPIQGGPLWYVSVGAWTVAGASLLALMLAPRLAVGARGATLAVLAVLGSYAWLSEVLADLNARSEVLRRADPSTAEMMAIELILVFLAAMVPASIAAAASADVVRDRRGRRWTEWAGLSLTLATVVLLGLMLFPPALERGGWSGETIFLASMIVVAIASGVVGSRFVRSMRGRGPSLLRARV